MDESGQPGTKPTTAFGREMYAWRKARRITWDNLAASVLCSVGMLRMVERGERAPTPQLAEALDKLWGLPDTFTRLLGEMPHGGPTWFDLWVRYEQSASELRIFEPLTVPGPLQTEAYARALIDQGEVTSERAGELVAARLARQRILERAVTCVLLDEVVLKRRVGGAKVMFDQLLRLEEVAALPKATVQVISADEGEYPGSSSGAYAIVNSPDGDAVHLDAAIRGHTDVDAETVETAVLMFERARSYALTSRKSLDLIRKVAGEYEADLG